MDPDPASGAFLTLGSGIQCFFDPLDPGIILDLIFDNLYSLLYKCTADRCAEHR